MTEIFILSISKQGDLIIHIRLVVINYLILKIPSIKTDIISSATDYYLILKILSIK